MITVSYYKVYQKGSWGSNPIFAHPQILIYDFNVSWGKMCKNGEKKYMEREGKNIYFSKLLILYHHYLWHINY